MQIACEVRRKLASSPGEILLDHFKIPFAKAPIPESKLSTNTRAKSVASAKLTKEQAANISKAAWMRRMGIENLKDITHGG